MTLAELSAFLSSFIPNDDAAEWRPQFQAMPLYDCILPTLSHTSSNAGH